jgi:uncharacterized membrane protein YkvI
MSSSCQTVGSLAVNSTGMLCIIPTLMVPLCLASAQNQTEVNKIISSIICMWILIICSFFGIKSLCLYNPTWGWIAITVLITLNMIVSIFCCIKFNSNPVDEDLSTRKNRKNEIIQSPTSTPTSTTLPL